MKKLLYGVVLAMVMSSCVMYHPQVTDIPLLREKGDGHIDMSAAFSPLFIFCPTVDVNVSGSYAVTDHIAGQAFVSFSDVRNAHLQASAGGFQTFNDYMVLEGFLGFANGWSHDDWESSQHNQYIDGGNYQQYFAQVDFGFAGLLDNHLDIGLGLRSGMFVPHFSEQITRSDGTIEVNTACASRSFFEPQLMVRLGGEHVKFRISAALNLMPDMPSDTYQFNHSPLNVGMGINFCL